MLSRTISLVAAGAVAGLAGSSSGEIFVATFDKLAEGHTTTVLVDGLITFRDLDQRIPGSTPPYPLVIEDASATLNGQPWFYPPNALGFGGYSPGPGASFGRFGSMRIIPPELCIWATVNVYEFLTGPGNSIVLAGYRNGVEVVRSTVPIAGGGGVHYYELRVESVLTGFDEFVLMGEGPNDQGVFFRPARFGHDEPRRHVLPQLRCLDRAARFEHRRLWLLPPEVRRGRPLQQLRWQHHSSHPERCGLRLLPPAVRRRLRLSVKTTPG